MSQEAEKIETSAVPSIAKNLHIWNEVERTDPEYTKSFTRGGGFKGTAANATYLAMKATKMFGPIGIGWGIKVLKEEMLEGRDGTLIHKIHALFWYMWQGQRGEIEQFGQTEFSGTRSNGKHYTDEEAPKKSLTDAMTKCMSLLGFAADIHLGFYDDVKYVAELKKDFRHEDEFEGRYGSGGEPKPETKADNVIKMNLKGDPPPRDADDGKGQDDGLTDEELVDELKDEISKLTDSGTIAAFMKRKSVLEDIASLPKGLATEVNNFAKDHLKKAMAAGKKPAAAKKETTTKVSSGA